MNISLAYLIELIYMLNSTSKGRQAKAKGAQMPPPAPLKQTLYGYPYTTQLQGSIRPACVNPALLGTTAYLILSSLSYIHTSIVLKMELAKMTFMIFSLLYSLEFKMIR